MRPHNGLRRPINQLSTKGGEPWNTHHPTHPNNQNSKGRKSPRARPSVEPVPETRIYVASLSDYNDGRLHGVWLDANAEAEELDASIHEMLARSPMPGAEEWAIHDYEGFGPVRLGEYEDLATVSQIAQGMAEHGSAFAHWAAICDSTDPEDLARFDDVYLGHWDSLETYAGEFLDDLDLDDLIEEAVPDFLQPYLSVDLAGFARDLEYAGGVASSEGDNGVYLFDQAR